MAGLVGLTENDFLVLTMPRTPCPDAPLQGPPDTGRQIRMPAKHLLKYGNGPQAGSRLEKWDNLGVEDLCQRVWSAPTSRLRLLGREFAALEQPIGGRPADTGLAAATGTGSL